MNPRTATILLLALAPLAAAEPPFHVYVPSPKTKQLWSIKATPSSSGLQLDLESRTDLAFQAHTISTHPTQPILFIGSAGGPVNHAPAATVTLSPSGAVEHVSPFELKHGTAYLSTDKTGRFLLSADYGSGAIDAYKIDGTTPTWVDGRDEGRKNAHCILISPDNRSLYIPYVKEANGLLQYHFDPSTGSIKPMAKTNALPPEGTGPRHMAYHPSLPVVYFSNEQHLGVSVYDRGSDGSLSFRRACEAVSKDESKEGISSSDIVITPDGRFLFTGIRGHRGDFDWIARYQVSKSGDVTLMGRTPADKIPWGFALSPKSEFLFVTAYNGSTISAYRIGNDGSLEKVASLPCDQDISDIVTR